MDNTRIDSALQLRTLGGSIALLLLSALTAVVVVFNSQHHHDQASVDYRQTQAEQASGHERLARAHDEAQELRHKIERYRELVERGRLQPERRLDWVETLQAIKEKRRLPGLDYEIAPQQPLDPKNPLHGGHRFLVSPMKLDLPLLHENDLVGLLADLSAQVHPLVSVRRCKIERMAHAATVPGTPLLKAACEIDWITVQEKP